MSDYGQGYQPVRSNGFYESGVNDYPASQSLIAHNRNASPSGTDAVRRVTAVPGSDNATALDVALRDHAGQRYSATNPLFVTPVDPPLGEVQDFNGTQVNGLASVNHDFTPTGTFKVKSVLVSGVLDSRFQLLVNAVNKAAAYCSPASPTAPPMVFDPPIEVPAGQVVRVTKTNRNALAATDLNSTIVGYYVS